MALAAVGDAADDDEDDVGDEDEVEVEKEDDDPGDFEAALVPEAFRVDGSGADGKA